LTVQKHYNYVKRCSILNQLLANLQEHELLTITNGGFVLAESAQKYPDDSHQAYHLHKKKKIMQLS